jgi:urea transport system permease protein
MDTVLSIAIDATLITLVLALAAFGLAIIYGLIGVINLSHGAMLTLGAYFTWSAMSLGLPFLAAVVLGGIGVGLIGLVLEHVLLRHFYDRPFDTILLTWGFFIVATEVIKIVFGAEFRNIASPLSGAIDIGFYKIPAYRTAVAAFAAVVLLLSALVFYRTSLGIRIRALVQNREVAALLGLDVDLTYKLVFGFGAFMAGLAGGLIAPMLAVGPYMGDIYLVRSFFVVIVGGVGSILSGTLAGSFVIGGSETLLATFTDQVIAQVAVFFLAIMVLRFRPYGLFGKK